MMRSGKLYFFFICAVAGAVAALVAAGVRDRLAHPQTEGWKLGCPVTYTEEIQRRLAGQEEAGNACAYWHRRKGVTVKNQDIGRQAETAMYYIAGNSSALFPDENGLSVYDGGKCLLSGDMAWELFGSTDIAGKKVTADGKEYVVAGVIFQKKGACVCELGTGDRQRLTHAAVLCGSGRDRQLCRQIMNSWAQDG